MFATHRCRDTAKPGRPKVRPSLDEPAAAPWQSESWARVRDEMSPDA